MSFVHDEFKDYLLKIADELQGDDYRSVIKSHLGDPLDEDEKVKIRTACDRLISVVGGKERDEFIDNFEKLIKKRKKIEKKYGKELVNRQDAIKYTEQSESNFDKVVRDENNNINITYRGGKPYFSIDDLKKITKAINLNSTKLALCINTHYRIDHRSEGFFPFYGGEYYEIILENERYVKLYNEKWDAHFDLRRSEFKLYFKVEQDLKFGLK